MRKNLTAVHEQVKHLGKGTWEQSKRNEIFCVFPLCNISILHLWLIYVNKQNYSLEQNTSDNLHPQGVLL
jgi:hypothetical protein